MCCLPHIPQHGGLVAASSGQRAFGAVRNAADLIAVALQGSTARTACQVPRLNSSLHAAECQLAIVRAECYAEN